MFEPSSVNVFFVWDLNIYIIEKLTDFS
jgi:hypothetical protein